MCKGNCKECKQHDFKTASSKDGHFIYYCHVCNKHGINADSFKELYENVKEELN